MTRVLYYDLRTGARTEPREVDENRPELSWKRDALDADNTVPNTHVVLDELDAFGAVVSTTWSTELDALDVSVRLPYDVLKPRTRYRWSLSPAAERDDASNAVSSVFETGFRETDWTASWISRDVRRRADSDGEPIDQTPGSDLRRSWATMYLDAPGQFRREFEASEAPLRARLYVSAHGIYRAAVNGVRVGADELTPGWTRYESRVDYQAYDVTALVGDGVNVLSAVVADGWWSGYVGYDTRKQARLYGDTPELIAQLHLEFADGTESVLVTDESWKVSSGEIVVSDLLMGELHDVKSSTPGWEKAHFDDSNWLSATPRVASTAMLCGQQADPIRVIAELSPISVNFVSGIAVVDFGQNIAGRVRLLIRDADAGDVIELRHGEVLDGDAVYTDNLRSAEARDVVVASGEEAQTFEPVFTLHGFRFVEIRGLKKAPSLADVTAIAMSSDLPLVGGFTTGSTLVNQLQSNIMWSMRDNFVGVPTDCPQRDERLGWSADIQIFGRTASFNVDTRSFLGSWMRDLFASQTAEGRVPDVAPVPPGSRNFDEGAPGWGDAAVIVPWTLFEEYGDRDLLADHYPHMRAWVEWVESRNPGSLWTRALGNNFGDWLSVDEHTPHGLVAAAYQIHSLDLLALAAAELGYAADQTLFARRARLLRELFTEKFVNEDRIEGDTQSSYLFTLAWDLAPESVREALADRLVEKIERRGRRLTSGFHGTNLLAPVLTRIGRSDLALAMVLQREFPSWGYSIDQGATTIWERWDGFTEQTGFHDVRMNSFNHYSFGAIGEWLYRTVGGIAQAPGSVAYRRLRIAPLITEELSPVTTWHESPRGRIEVSWSTMNHQGSALITVPPGTVADVVLPGLEATVGAGRHEFAFDLEEALESLER